MNACPNHFLPTASLQGGHCPLLGGERPGNRKRLPVLSRKPGGGALRIRVFLLRTEDIRQISGLRLNRLPAVQFNPDFAGHIRRCDREYMVSVDEKLPDGHKTRHPAHLP